MERKEIRGEQGERHAAQKTLSHSLAFAYPELIKHSASSIPSHYSFPKLKEERI